MIESLHWAFQPKRRPRAVSFMRWLGGPLGRCGHICRCQPQGEGEGAKAEPLPSRTSSQVDQRCAEEREGDTPTGDAKHPRGNVLGLEADSPEHHAGPCQEEGDHHPHHP